MEEEAHPLQENFIVTTGMKIHLCEVDLAKETARRLNARYIPRGTMSLHALRKKYQVDFILVAKKGQLFVDTGEEEFFFHPNMAYLRIKNLRLGKKDHFLEATSLKEGESLLDCTLGFASDALVASFAVGSSGKVIGLESSKLIATVVAYGLRHGIHTTLESVKSAMQNIAVINSEAENYLKKIDAHSFDVVYFDPMFRHPFKESVSMNSLRPLADHRPLTESMIEEACRVARKRVVLKESSKSLEFSRLGFFDLSGGKYSNIRYGIIKV